MDAFYALPEGLTHVFSRSRRLSLPHRISGDTMFQLLECVRLNDAVGFWEILSTCTEVSE